MFTTICGLVFDLAIAPQATAAEANGLRAEYFANAYHSGLPVLTRTDAQLLMDWQGGSPGPTVPIDHFSARWTGEVLPEFTENYTFVIAADDGVRVWIDGRPLVNKLNTQTSGTYEVTVPLVAGRRTPIKVEYCEGYGWASIHLAWYSTSRPWELIPTARLFPTTPTAAETNSPVVQGYFSSIAGSAALVPSGSGDLDFFFHRPWNLGCTHYTVVEVSTDLRSWTDVSNQVEHRDTFDRGSVDEIRLTKTQANLANYLGTQSSSSGGGSNSIPRAFFRVRYVSVAG